MGVLGGLLLVTTLVALLWWLDHAACLAETREDAKLLDEIRHLPLDTRVRLWAAHLRAKADRDLH